MSTSEFYPLSEQDVLLAQHGAIKYVAGVAYMHDPEATRPHHRFDIKTQGHEIAESAASLILNGLGTVIKFANPPHLRAALRKMERNYEEALPNLLDIQIELYGEEHYVDELVKKASEHFPSISALAPFPILDEGIYKRFCHRHFGSIKLPIYQMMDGVTVDERLKEFVKPHEHGFRRLLKQPQIVDMDDAFELQVLDTEETFESGN